MSKQYFMAVFVCKTPEVNVYGRNTYKTISSYVDDYDNFESTINYFARRFTRQNFELQEITVFASEINFKDDWEALKLDDTVHWGKKNAALLERRPDITSTNVFCADDFKPRKCRR